MFERACKIASITGAVLLISATMASADVVLLKNGGRLEGVIVKKTKDTVVIRVGGGKMTLKRDQIRKIIERSKSQNEDLKKKQKDEEERLRKEAQEAKAKKGKTPAGKKEVKAVGQAADEQGRLESKPQRVQSGQANFQITLPKGWVVVKDSKSSMLLSARRSGGVYADLNVTSFPSRGQSLGRLRARLLQSLKTNYKGFKVLNSGIESHNGANHFVVEGEYVDNKVKTVMVVSFTDSGKAFKYGIYFRVAASAYKDLKDVITKSRTSFRP